MSISAASLHQDRGEPARQAGNQAGLPVQANRLVGDGIGQERSPWVGEAFALAGQFGSAGDGFVWGYVFSQGPWAVRPPASPASAPGNDSASDPSAATAASASSGHTCTGLSHVPRFT